MNFQWFYLSLTDGESSKAERISWMSGELAVFGDRCDAKNLNAQTN